MNPPLKPAQEALRELIDMARKAKPSSEINAMDEDDIVEFLTTAPTMLEFAHEAQAILREHAPALLALLDERPEIEGRIPEKIDQTITGEKGNCFSACLAMMLGLQVADIPNFFEQGANDRDWWIAVRSWLADYNVGVINIGMWGDYLKNQKGFLIVGGMGKRGHHHAVIYKDGELWHDPHPDKDGIETPDSVDLLYPLNPLKPFARAYAATPPKKCPVCTDPETVLMHRETAMSLMDTPPKAAGALSDADFKRITTQRMDPRHDHLNAEMDTPADVAPKAAVSQKVRDKLAALKNDLFLIRTLNDPEGDLESEDFQNRMASIQKTITACIAELTPTKGE